MNHTHNVLTKERLFDLLEDNKGLTDIELSFLKDLKKYNRGKKRIWCTERQYAWFEKIEAVKRKAKDFDGDLRTKTINFFTGKGVTLSENDLRFLDTFENIFEASANFKKWVWYACQEYFKTDWYLEHWKQWNEDTNKYKKITA